MAVLVLALCVHCHWYFVGSLCNVAFISARGRVALIRRLHCHATSQLDVVSRNGIAGALRANAPPYGQRV